MRIFWLKTWVNFGRDYRYIWDIFFVLFLCFLNHTLIETKANTWLALYHSLILFFYFLYRLIDYLINIFFIYVFKRKYVAALHFLPVFAWSWVEEHLSLFHNFYPHLLYLLSFSLFYLLNKLIKMLIYLLFTLVKHLLDFSHFPNKYLSLYFTFLDHKMVIPADMR